MTTKWIPPQQTLRQKRIAWMNLLTHVHDFMCSCDEPLKHTKEEIENQEPTLKTTCPGTGENLTTEDILGDVDLDAFFAENIGEDAAAATEG